MYDVSERSDLRLRPNSSGFAFVLRRSRLRKFSGRNATRFVFLNRFSSFERLCFLLENMYACMYVHMYVCMYVFEYVTDSSSKKRPLLECPEDLMSCSDSPRDRPCTVGFDERVTAPNMLTMDASLHGFRYPLSTACMYVNM
jgi:hypothetical protein